MNRTDLPDGSITGHRYRSLPDPGIASFSDFPPNAALAGAFVTWKRVAGVVAKDIEQWARDNSESLNGEP